MTLLLWLLGVVGYLAIGTAFAVWLEHDSPRNPMNVVFMLAWPPFLSVMLLQWWVRTVSVWWANKRRQA